MMSYDQFFHTATRHDPYEYQKEFAKNTYDVIDVPTGSGKTEAVILSYMWNRKNKFGPKRLIYCLPTRVLVEQTVSRIKKWVKNLDLDVSVVTIMGGNQSQEYSDFPEEDAIIVGTQDMLLSRALNRGYGISPTRWPKEFGILNNDSLWVMDEIQLMGDGLATSIQLDAFRKNLGTFGDTRTVWMSATVQDGWDDTPDAMEDLRVLRLSDYDKKGMLSKPLNAKKTVHVMNLKSSLKKYEKPIINTIVEHHVKGTVTMLIVNTVQRAQEAYSIITGMSSHPDVMLVHSRFRHLERAGINDRLSKIKEKTDLIIISTQVIEAGIDISARTLFTEMAPWSSLIQRFGRCNRRGEYTNADIHVIPIHDSSPYGDQSLEESRTNLKNMKETASPINMKTLGKTSYDYILRRTHLDASFDTAVDMMGGHTDISPYVRSLDGSKDVFVFWNDINIHDEYHPSRDEICRVNIGAAKKWCDEKRGMRRYDRLLKEWTTVNSDDLHPGETIMVHPDTGGYDEDRGWYPSSPKPVTFVSKNREKTCPNGKDYGSDKRVLLADHTEHVRSKAVSILDGLGFGDHWPVETDIIERAAILHDIGKAHPTFQERLPGNTCNEHSIWAKWDLQGDHRKLSIFRHELVSAMVALCHDEPVLLAYLIMTHHGHIRMSLRYVKTKKTKAWDILGVPAYRYDSVPSYKCSKNARGYILEPDGRVNIRADMAHIGLSGNTHSWIRIVCGLLDKYGPFKLAFMETVLRAADARSEAKDT